MTKIKNLLVLMLLLVLGALSACGDDDETEQQIKTRQLSNDDKPWNITAVDVVGTGDYDYISGTSTITFKSGGSYTLTNPVNLPEIRDPFGNFPATGTWAFASPTNLNSLVLTPTSGSPITLTITSLTDNALVFEYPGALGKAENQVSVKVTAAKQ